jgi:hypothetical protein
MILVYWQCRPEKPTRPLMLNKDTIWYGLNLMSVQETIPIAFIRLENRPSNRNQKLTFTFDISYKNIYTIIFCFNSLLTTQL